jgi:hypothetical protein
MRLHTSGPSKLPARRGKLYRSVRVVLGLDPGLRASPRRLWLSARSDPSKRLSWNERHGEQRKQSQPCGVVLTTMAFQTTGRRHHHRSSVASRRHHASAIRSSCNTTTSRCCFSFLSFLFFLLSSPDVSAAPPDCRRSQSHSGICHKGKLEQTYISPQQDASFSVQGIDLVIVDSESTEKQLVLLTRDGALRNTVQLQSDTLSFSSATCNSLWASLVVRPPFWTRAQKHVL